MKRIAISFALILSLMIPVISPANANVFNFANLIVTLPDSVSITGSDTGTGVRKCIIKGSIDAAPGTTIPLRAGASVIIYDSLLTRLNSAYAAASVEGLTHLDLVFSENCSPVPGTVKPPYRWGVNVFMVPCDSRCNADASVDVIFMSPTPTPTPTGDCKREGQRFKVSGLDYICTDNGVALIYLPEEKANEFIAAKKKMEDFYTKSSELGLRLNSAESAANTLQLKKLIKVTLKDVVSNVNFYKVNKLNPFDYLGATTQLELYEKRSEAIFKLIEKQKTPITCIKGSVKKQVSGKDPKCPKGFKKV